MFYVENYFKKLALNDFIGNKYVFVASDDINVMKELKVKYSDFMFIDEYYLFNEKEGSLKHTPKNLLHTLIDIHFLSRSDFLVCTMSSNVRIYLFQKLT
jgi:glycoprotein 6-alpha-L-fucosyltransferase